VDAVLRDLREQRARDERRDGEEDDGGDGG
jgi:hypothetical protein